uniref:Gag protein n=1 Tax=Panagrolaimus superbus TaxID=310955 RepID=A0A914YBS1_9BILA
MTPTPSVQQASGDATVKTSVHIPTIPVFVHNPTNPSSASTWLKQIEMKFKLAPGLTAEHKIAAVCAAFDETTFDRVTSALLPTDIETMTDWAKFKDVFINLFDMKRSLFADRYNTFQIEWLGPAHESLQECVSRIRRSVTHFDFSNFSANELSTLLLLMSMKAAALEPLRSLLLNALIKNPKESLEDVATLLENALLTERDQKLPEQKHINFVKKVGPSNSSKPPPRTPCPCCGAAHWRADCKFKNAICHTCGIKGHISKLDLSMLCQ